MALNGSSRFGRGLTFAATLPLKALPRFSTVELLVRVNELLDGFGVLAELDPELTTFEEEQEAVRMWTRPKAPPRVGLTLNGITISVVGHDRPGFSAAELAQLDDRQWPDTGGRIGRARAHLEIAEAGVSDGSDLDANHDRAVAITIVAQAAAKLTQAIGVVWHSSCLAVPIDRFERLTDSLAQGQAPMPLWLGCAPGRAPAGPVLTQGLYPLLGAEIEVVSAALAREAAFEVALEVAAETLRTGQPPHHGDRLGYDRDSEFDVAYRTPDGAHPIPTVVLAHVPRQDEPRIAVGAA